ncbi:hypothetical protein CVD25_14975 [Bacillus canaveralius]|uniref:Citrate transporter-like domain-containing protein n=1 Tax=Bacillus canaveralius TaxID=1403243 RepID=A0A2N5GMV4_9BACI|nr:hypothetical protein [Bacillus canaveralius]PLR83454.1 hypothetical protein CU635_09160 [Bacillus canaveralius]PLR95365.1 hypothetical protein CVD25_14975 [Bacillus canaveralius]
MEKIEMKRQLLSDRLQYASSIRGALLFLLGAIYLVYSVLGAGNDTLIVSAAVITFLYCFFFMNKAPRRITFVLVIIGHVFYFYYGGAVSYWKEAILLNLAFVPLFLSVPLLSIPMRLGGYDGTIVTIINKWSDKPFFVPIIVLGSSALLTSFMNIGALRVSTDLFRPLLESSRGTYTKAIMQGFCLSIIFSPYIAGVAIILFILDLTLIPFLFYALIFVILGFFISLFLFRIEVRSLPTWNADAKTISDEPETRKKLLELTIGFLGLFGSIIILDRIFDFNLIIIVSLIAIVSSLLWSSLIRKKDEMKSELKNYRKNILPNVHNESLMIITASFFSHMFQLSPFPQYILSIFVFFTNHSQVFVILMILSSIVLFSLLGVHQIVTVSIMANSIDPNSLDLSSIMFAITLTIGWAMGTLLSPVSALNIIGTNLLNVRYQDLLKWNWQFAIIMMIITSIMITLINYIILAL